MAGYIFPKHCRKCQYFLRNGDQCCGYLLMTGKSLLREFGYMDGSEVGNDEETERISNDIRNRCLHFKDKKRRSQTATSVEASKEMNRRRMELYKKGLNDVQIAKMENVSVSTIHGWRVRNGLKNNYDCTVEREEREKEYLRLYKEGLTDAEVAKRCGVGRSTVEKWRISGKRPANKANKENPDEYYKRFMTAYFSSSCDEEIGKKVGKNKKTVQKYRAKHGLPPRSRR